MPATLWAIAAAVLVAGAVVLLWTKWKAAAFPGKAEIQAFMASGEKSAVINGWELSKCGPDLPDDEDDIVVDGGPRDGQSFFEAFILRPVSPNGEAASAGLACDGVVEEPSEQKSNGSHDPGASVGCGGGHEPLGRWRL